MSSILQLVSGGSKTGSPSLNPEFTMATGQRQNEYFILGKIPASKAGRPVLVLDQSCKSWRQIT